MSTGGQISAIARYIPSYWPSHLRRHYASKHGLFWKPQEFGISPRCVWLFGNDRRPQLAGGLYCRTGPVSPCLYWLIKQLFPHIKILTSFIHPLSFPLRTDSRGTHKDNKSLFSSSIQKYSFGVFKQSSCVCFKVEIKDEMIKHFFLQWGPLNFGTTCLGKYDELTVTFFKDTT